MPHSATSKLYHFEVYMPDRLKQPVFEGRLQYSHHAKSAAHDDRYGEIPLPQFFVAEGATLIEVETDGGIPVKQLWRKKLDKDHDLVMAITREGRVKTVWLNHARDKHHTLRTDRYEKETRIK